MSSSGPKLAQKGGRQRERFTRLMRHSIERVMHGGDESGELDFGIGAMLALLAAPGAFASVAASLHDEYFFIVLAMVAAGAVAIWKWDALIPDRRDYVNLAPLPIPAKQILYANLASSFACSRRAGLRCERGIVRPVSIDRRRFALVIRVPGAIFRDAPFFSFSSRACSAFSLCWRFLV